MKDKLSEMAYLTQLEAIQHRARMIKALFSNAESSKDFEERINYVIKRVETLIYKEEWSWLKDLKIKLEVIIINIPNSWVTQDKNIYCGEINRIKEHMIRILLEHGDVVTLDSSLFIFSNTTKETVERTHAIVFGIKDQMNLLDGIICAHHIIFADQIVCELEKQLIELKLYLTGKK